MSSFVPQLHFLRPDWLWALLLLPPLVAWWYRQRRQSDVWRRHVDAHLLPHLVADGTARVGVGALSLRVAAVLLAVLALAGPGWRQGEAQLEGGGGARVLALDLSDAMQAGDLPPSRLAQARAALARLLQAHAGGDVALLAFSEDAYTVAPLTDDGNNLALFLDALSPDLMPEDGHRVDRAIEASVRLLEQAGHARGDILLLTHGADARAIAAAARAQAAGFRVSVLGMGRPGGASYRARDGSLPASRLDSAMLRQVAAAGGGRYATPGSGGIDAALLDLGAASPPAAEATARTAANGRWRDEGYWLLLPLMLIVLLAFRRGAVLACLAAVLLLPVPPAQATPSVDAPVAGTPWQRPDQVAHARMRAGIEAYRAGRYDEAAQAWQALPGADAAYNRGNALARAGRYEDALRAYDEALRAEPRMDDALANRAAVQAALQRRPPTGPGSDGRQQEADADAGRRGQGDAVAGADPGTSPPGDADGDPGQGEARTPARPPPGIANARNQQADAAAEDAASPARDDDAQRQADAAQRARMQQALARGTTRAQDGQTVEGNPDRAESAAERERRQAAEAWLQRVSDDPGGLLRARFRLEHERRSGRRQAP